MGWVCVPRAESGSFMWNHKLSPHPPPPVDYTITSGLQLQFLLEKQKIL